MPDVTLATLAQTLTALQMQGLERLDAQLLLLHVLHQPENQRGWLLAHDSDLLASENSARLAQLALRRQAGEPLAYITGHKEFFGLDIKVDQRVLVPRPDTETLVSWALELLGDQQSALDLGTGSGAIALALKASLPRLHIHAIDISQEALDLAQTNAQRLQLDITLSQGTWFAGLTDPSLKFDCIVSNPPYIASLDRHLQALTFEPLQALASGTDGLDDIRQIITQAPRHLKPGAWLLLEHGYDQAQAVKDLLAKAGFTKIALRCDLAGLERCSGGQYHPDEIPP